MANENKHNNESLSKQERAGMVLGTAARLVVPLANFAVWTYAVFSVCNQAELSPRARAWVLIAFMTLWQVGRGFLKAARDARRQP